MKKTISIIAFSLVAQFSVTQNVFMDVAQSLGLSADSGAESVAVGDFNNDGWEDLYIGFPNKKNQLWKCVPPSSSTGQVSFVDVTELAGVGLADDSKTKTAVWGDLDNDGDLDLMVCNKDKPDVLFQNEGNETFSDITQAAGIYNLGNPLSLNMADLNGDGFLDIYISNFYFQNIFYQNNGDMTFTNKTNLSGAIDTREAMGTVLFDYDKDGDVDLYLTHDNYTPNLLYQNDGTGHFTDVAAMAGADTKSFAMGVDVGDINNDGWLDIYIANFNKNFLLLNNTDGTFAQIADSAGVADFGMGWGCTMFDFDNDALVDIYIGNDHIVAPYLNVLYKNMGNLTFQRAEDSLEVCNQFSTYGLASLDFNLDGNQDLVVTNRRPNEKVQIFQNADRAGNWIGMKLIGTTSNRQAVGATVTLTDNLGGLHYDELTAGNGWTSQNSSYFHFGLGTATTIQSASIRWPSGLVQQLSGLEVEKFYTVLEGQNPTVGISNGMSSVIEKPNGAGADVHIYPNPNQGQFFVKMENAAFADYSVQVHNPFGQLLFSEKMSENGVLTVDLGVYSGNKMVFVSVFGENGRVVRKVGVEGQ